MRLLSGSVLAVTLVVTASASAQEMEAPQTAATLAAPIPSMSAVRVGRVSFTLGKVGFRSAGDRPWSDAEINDPVSAGISLRTDPKSRTELRIGPDTVDLAEATEIAITQLNDQSAEINLSRGRIDLDIRRLGASENVQIDIPRGGVWLLRPGRYDVDAGSGDQPPRIAAFTGRARFAGGGADLPIPAGDALVLTGAGAVKAATEPAAGDEFAQWCGARAIDDTRLAAPYFVSRSMTGYAELDAAGSWRASEEYGATWVPNRVPADWAPFRDGHWRWIAPWGWTWIDGHTWGFAPSHYGRWEFADGHWAWVPGRFSARPAYAPAVVAFLGTPAVGLSYAGGSGPAIAWFPLAPGEVYWPSFTREPAAIRALNRGDIADLDIIQARADGQPPPEITNGHFANRQFASVVPRPVFVAGEAVAPALLRLPQERLLNAPAIMGSPQIGPPAPPAPARIAAAPAIGAGGRAHPPAEHSAVHGAKSASWAKIVRAAAIRSRNFQKAAIVRAAHLLAPVYAAASRLRHTIVLRMAHAAHASTFAETRKKDLKR